MAPLRSDSGSSPQERQSKSTVEFDGNDDTFQCSAISFSLRSRHGIQLLGHVAGAAVHHANESARFRHAILVKCILQMRRQVALSPVR